MSGLTELSSILSFAAVIISVAIGIGTLRQRMNEPHEKRWKEFYEWKEHIDENFTFDNEERWGEIREWRRNIDGRLNRDYARLNLVDLRFERHGDFEYIMLSSMKGILTHLSSGNHSQQMQEISQKIDDYLMEAKRKDILSAD